MFERSLELEASPGTLLNLGNCYEQDGDLARALATFERAVADSQLEPDETKRKAWTDAGTRRVDLLLARVPVLNLTPSPTADARMRLDGAELTQIRGPLRLNPGHHEIEVDAPGKQTLRHEFELRPAERLALALPALADAPSAAQPPQPPQPPQPQPSAPHANSGHSNAPWILIGGGALLAGAGVVTALMAKSKEDTLESGCRPGPVCSNPELRGTRDSGQRLEIATYVLWAVGGASMIAGVTLFALDSDEGDAPSQIALGCSGAACGLQAIGTF